MSAPAPAAPDLPGVLVTRRIPSAVADLFRGTARLDVAEAAPDHAALCERVRGKHALLCVLTDRWTPPCWMRRDRR